MLYAGIHLPGQIHLYAGNHLPGQIHKGGVCKPDCSEMQHLSGMLGCKRVAMTSDQAQALRALQQRVPKDVNVEMVLTNSKRYGSQSNGKLEEAILEVEG